MSENKELNGIVTKVEGRDLIIERIFNAPRDLVFKMFSEPEYLSSWWGPKGWQTENREFNFMPEGTWHYCIRCLDKSQVEFYGQEAWGKVVYKEITKPDRIIYIDYFSNEEGTVDDSLPETLVTMTFIELGGKTRVVVSSRYNSEEDRRIVMEMGVVEGVTSQFHRLEEYLVELLNVSITNKNRGDIDG